MKDLMVVITYNLLDAELLLSCVNIAHFTVHLVVHGAPSSLLLDPHSEISNSRESVRRNKIG